MSESLAKPLGMSIEPAFVRANFSQNGNITADGSLTERRVNVGNNGTGNIVLDGSLTDWRAIDRLDAATRQQIAGYRVYGKNTDAGYVLAIDSSQAEIGINTTIWLNIDRDKTTGYQVFGSTVGAEYNINIAADGKPYLYSGSAGQNLIGAVDFASSSDGKTIEIIIPKVITSTVQIGIEAYIDVNDRVFLPGDYANNSLSIGSMDLPNRTSSDKRIAIVYSETSANNYLQSTIR
jgi:serralysin